MKQKIIFYIYIIYIIFLIHSDSHLHKSNIHILYYSHSSLIRIISLRRYEVDWRRRSTITYRRYLFHVYVNCTRARLINSTSLRWHLNLIHRVRGYHDTSVDVISLFHRANRADYLRRANGNVARMKVVTVS